MNNLNDNGMPSSVWYSGTVAHGLKNGRSFGYPTANIIGVNPPLELASGVYAAKVRVGGCEYGAMLYVGTRPTLGLEELTVEIFLFDFEGYLYNQLLQFAIHGKIRDEKHFPSVDELIAQLRRDEAEIREKLKNESRKLKGEKSQ